MGSKNNIIFQPVRNTCHVFWAARNQPLIRVSTTDSTAKKSVALLVNSTKKRVAEIAFAIAALFAFLYSLITYPIRLYQVRKNAELGTKMDLARLSPNEMREVDTTIHTYLFGRHKEIYGFLSPEEKNELTRKIIAQVARSEKVYAPVVRSFVDHLLETANRNGRKLVFMARDGIPFYKVAKKLMKTPEYQKQYPNLTKNGSIVLGYFSRELVKRTEPNIFKKYVSEELGIQEGDRCFFADVGFNGSMVDPIRELLPKVEIDFKFLVATSDKAEGFLGNPDRPLPNLETAAHNLGVGWLEETHHGNVVGAEKLVVGEDDRVYPNNLYPKKVLRDEKYSTPYLIRKFCLKRAVNCASKLDRLSKEAVEKAREVFSTTIGEIKSLKLPFELDWEY